MARLQDISKRTHSFLDLTAWSEGTSTIKESDDGFNVIVGGNLFDDYSDHPNILVDLPRLGIKSSAAGRYQILYRYWKHYKAQLGLPDFSPESQDKYAIQQFRERRALEDIEAGKIKKAIEKCSNIWASFPANSYGQYQHSYGKLLQKYDEIWEFYERKDFVEDAQEIKDWYDRILKEV